MKQRINNKGFTIIELLIATVIFSVILLVITGAIVQFGRMYYRGVIQARTQDVARAISQDIGQTVMFSRGAPATAQQGTTPVWVTCVGNKRYTYIKGEQVGGTYKHGLVSDTPNSCSTGSPVDMTAVTLPAGAREYLGEGMQLLQLDIAETPAGLVDLSVRVAYGQDADLTASQDACKPIVLGGQFCAISTLTTTVTPRLK